MTFSSRSFSQWFGFSKSSVARIEPIGSEHAATLAAIHEQSFAQGWNEAEFEHLLTDRHMVSDGLFIDQDKEPSGFILSRRVLDEAEIISVAIAPAKRHHGLSYPLLKQHIDALMQLGTRTLHLEVGESNVAARALYRRAGFTVTGERKGYYTQADGRRTTALTMSLTL